MFSERFPSVEQALTQTDGLLAIGGELSQTRLLEAYQQGIFPWYTEDQPIMWWFPDPRCVLFPDELRISRSLKRALRQQDYTVTFDQSFADVIAACAAPRGDNADLGTWITQDIMDSYLSLHQAGYAHSVECWQYGELVAGLYGVAIGRVFFGESMFSRVSDLSKVCLVHLVRFLQAEDYVLIDCQVYSQHLASLGARLIPGAVFSGLLGQACETECTAPWRSVADDV